MVVIGKKTLTRVSFDTTAPCRHAFRPPSGDAPLPVLSFNTRVAAFSRHLSSNTFSRPSEPIRALTESSASEAQYLNPASLSWVSTVRGRKVIFPRVLPNLSFTAFRRRTSPVLCETRKRKTPDLDGYGSTVWFVLHCFLVPNVSTWLRYSIISDGFGGRLNNYIQKIYENII